MKDEELKKDVRRTMAAIAREDILLKYPQYIDMAIDEVINFVREHDERHLEDPVLNDESSDDV